MGRGGDRISYIDDLNSFHGWLKTHYLPGKAQLLYYRLLGLFNEVHWPESLQVDNYHLMSMVDTRTERVAICARDKLVEAGFIRYAKGKKGRPNTYYLTQCTPQKVSENDSVSVSETVSISGSENSSHIKNKTKKKTKDLPPNPPRGASVAPKSYDIAELERMSTLKIPDNL